MTISSEFTVFISYSHESDELKSWVDELSKLLNMESGFNVLADSKQLKLGSDINQFMRNGIREADLILCICTPGYLEKFDSMEGGVGFEAMLSINRQRKNLPAPMYVPIFSDFSNVPDVMQGKLGVPVTFETGEAFEKDSSNIIRLLHEARVDKLLSEVQSNIEIPEGKEAEKLIDPVVNLSFNSCLYKELQYVPDRRSLRIFARPIIAKEHCRGYLHTGRRLERLFAIEPFRLFYKLAFIQHVELQIEFVEASDRYQRGIYSLELSKKAASLIIDQEIDLLREFFPDGSVDIDVNWRHKILPYLDQKAKVREFFNQKVKFR